MNADLYTPGQIVVSHLVHHLRKLKDSLEKLTLEHKALLAHYEQEERRLQQEIESLSAAASEYEAAIQQLKAGSE